MQMRHAVAMAPRDGLATRQACSEWFGACLWRTLRLRTRRFWCAGHSSAALSVEMADAELEALNRAHHEHMMEMVNTAQRLENKRQSRLGAAKSRAEAAQLEKRFTRERRHEETRIQQIQEEHNHLCQVRGLMPSRPFPPPSRPFSRPVLLEKDSR